MTPRPKMAVLSPGYCYCVRYVANAMRPLCDSLLTIATRQKPGAASRPFELASAVGALAAGLAFRPAAVPLSSFSTHYCLSA